MDSFKDVLEAAQMYCKAQMAEPTYNLYIDGLEPISFEDSSHITLSVRNDFICKIVTDRYLGLLKEAFKSVLGFDVDITLVVPSTPPHEVVLAQQYEANPASPQGNYEFTFENFIRGPSNQFAFAAAQAVAANPSGAYNPLFIYGPSGLGKTHLLNAIQIEIHKNHPDYNIVYVDCEKFTNEIITAVKMATTEQFRQKYREADVLLIDDIQFIIGKESSQLEFFNTFETLFQLNKQIVISSDKPPRDMPELDDRYRTRFSSGLLVDIQPPDYETSMAILNNFKEKESIQVDEEVLRFIATNIRSSVRELEGAFKKVQYFSTLSHQKITLELAENALKDMIKPDSAREITVEYIIDIVTDHFQLSSDAIVSKKRQKTIAYPRQICMYLCKELTDLSTTEIGEKIGGRDHSTVIHGCAKIEELINTDPTVKKMIDILIKKINP